MINFSGFKKMPYTLLETNPHTTNRFKYSKDAYSLLTAIFGSFMGLIDGYILTLSCLLLSDQFFVSLFQLDGLIYYKLKYLLIYQVGSIVGALCSSFPADKLGRKSTLITSAVLCLLSFLSLSISNTVSNMITSRFLCGLSIGIGLSTAPVYTSEMASCRERGQVVGFISLLQLLGSIISLIIYYSTLCKYIFNSYTENVDFIYQSWFSRWFIFSDLIVEYTFV